ncbi:MAG TPA: hypothetical protein VN838_01055 [Bradyrhizobium sp.]|nr:hypothetical protein [Bradyrhizobium sp.]
MLTAICEDIASFRTSFEARLDRLEQSIRNCQRDAAATTIILRATVGHFNKRLSAGEKRITTLEIPEN